MNTQQGTKSASKALVLNEAKREKPVQYKPFGSDATISLTINLVQNTLAVKTKTGRTCSEADAVKFMMMCQAQALNPYAGDAYLVGYDGADGPKFSLITAHQAYLKRAEVHPLFKGMESGIILLKDDDTLEDRESDFHLRDEVVVGGWAIVHFFPDKEFPGREARMPIKRRIRMDRFNEGFAQWKKDAAGMIVKCAEADALRSAFPNRLGGLYLAGEIDMPINIESSVVGQEPYSPRLLVSSEPAPGELEPPSDEAGEATPPEQEKEKGGKKSQPAANSPQDDLSRLATENNITFDTFQKWAVTTDQVPGADSIDGWSSVPAAHAERLLRNKQGLMTQLKNFKG